MSDDEREGKIYHGTTKGVAVAIVGAKKFQEKETFFASEKSLAEYFAKRSHKKRSTDGGPAVVSVSLYESDLKDWKAARDYTPLPFDESDAPELKNKIQLKFKSGGMTKLNRYMFKDTLKVE